MNYLGTRLRELREENELLLRQLAATLEIDTALLSKIERGERRANRDLVEKLGAALSARKDELIILWLADKIDDAIEGEPLAEKALKLIESKKQ
jgi:transcriptional regulator with XRE-family HTH domain